jgi:hypothetical protein
VEAIFHPLHSEIRIDEDWIWVILFLSQLYDTQRCKVLGKESS